MHPAAGPGTEDKDAASVRSDHSVPARCGLYYFEVKVVSSGNDGFIGETELEGQLLLDHHSLPASARSKSDR